MKTARTTRTGLTVVLASAALVSMVACGDQGLDEAMSSTDSLGIDDDDMNDDGGLTGDGADDDAGLTSAGDGDGDGDDDGLFGTCASLDESVAPVARPTVMLLIDQSGSMNEDFGGQSRWDAVDSTLFDTMDGVVPRLEDSVSFGLSLYTSNGGFAGGTCPMMTTVDTAFDNADALGTKFADNAPGGDTPTGEALEAAADQLAGVQAEGPKVIVLATDGEPDTCAAPNPQNGQPESIAGAQYAHGLGIETYVVSVGSDTSESHLQQLANAGRGLSPDGTTNVPYFQALDGDDLYGAFGKIASNVIGCEFELDAEIDPGVECFGTVEVDGAPMTCGDDFEVEGKTLRLLNDACIMLTDGDAHQVTADFPCQDIAVG